MPTFYNTTMQRQMPLTPPEYLPFPHAGGQFNTIGHPVYGLNAGEHHYSGDHQFNDPYRKHAYAKQAGNHYGGRRDMVADPRNGMNYPSHNAHRDSGFGVIGAPVLPPIRLPDHIDLNMAHRNIPAPQAQVQQQKPKEEKVTGGVATHLDYEMEQMVDFVAEMAQGIVQPDVEASPQFRKYVSQILTSTRLPSSTIMLALHYLQTRMNFLASHNIRAWNASQVYHLFTTALMLASKFLDDNTFQNRSWSEVSRIAVTELNRHEMEWLVDMDWNLHIDIKDPQGLSAWIKKWESRKMALSMEALKITPVETALPPPQHTPHSYLPPTPLYTPTYAESVYDMSARDRSSPHWGQPWTSSRNLSPQAIHSGSNTPEWCKTQEMSYAPNQGGWYNSRMHGYPPVRSNGGSPHYPGYNAQYNSSWAHVYGCACSSCAASARFAMGQPHGVQPVVG